MVRRFILILASLAVATLGSRMVTAAPAQVIGNAWKLCNSHIAHTEAVGGIPQHLLKAISLAETGRWDSVRQANLAWPWTVMAKGKGNYFPDKDSALEYVYNLKKQGITNIDVGCMQINLFYHGGAFESLEHAMDPAMNIAYAAKYLKGLYGSTRSWTQAAAYYHSTTPTKARSYKMKVLKYWNQERRLASRKDRKAVDRERMAKLNANHRQLRQAALNVDHTDLRGSQLAAWRTKDPKGHDMATQAAMRRAAKTAQWHEKYMKDGLGKNPESFAERRRKQLEKWRLSKASRS
jgi:hypothetical protein